MPMEKQLELERQAAHTAWENLNIQPPLPDCLHGDRLLLLLEDVAQEVSVVPASEGLEKQKNRRLPIGRTLAFAASLGIILGGLWVTGFGTYLLDKRATSGVGLTPATMVSQDAWSADAQPEETSYAAAQSAAESTVMEKSLEFEPVLLEGDADEVELAPKENRVLDTEAYSSIEDTSIEDTSLSSSTYGETRMTREISSFPNSAGETSSSSPAGTSPDGDAAKPENASILSIPAPTVSVEEARTSTVLSSLSEAKEVIPWGKNLPLLDEGWQFIEGAHAQDFLSVSLRRKDALEKTVEIRCTFPSLFQRANLLSGEQVQAYLQGQKILPENSVPLFHQQELTYPVIVSECANASHSQLHIFCVDGMMMTFTFSHLSVDEVWEIVS